MHRSAKKFENQCGVILIEVLVAILIFSLGVLGMLGVNAFAIRGQSDAQYRSEASRLAEGVVSEIWVNVDRSSDAALAASLAQFSHRADVDACSAELAGTPSSNVLVTGWVATVSAGGADGLPGATDRMQQIVIDPTVGNQVTVTVCWKAPSDAWVRKHVYTTYIN